MAASLHSRSFGFLPSGEPVELWTLCGAGGLTVETMTYGGIVTRILAPDRNGASADVVLGFNDLDSYLAGHPYFGAIAGRVAGRISGARFDLDGTHYELGRNDPPNHLHGGLRGFDKRVWSASAVNRADGAPSLRLTYCSPAGEEGYPGTVQVAVSYTVTDDNIFLIETEATTDQVTPFNLTHHSYFNLAGESSGSVANHELSIDAEESVVADATMTLLGQLQLVDGQVNDLRKARRLSDVMPDLFQKHGDLYRISRGGAERELAQAARLVEPESGRILTVSTTDAYLQLYTGASLDGSLVGKSGIPYSAHAGICLECEGYPDGVNTPELGDILLQPGMTKYSTTMYAFSAD